MSSTHRSATRADAATGRTLAGLAVRLLERHASDIPAAEQNDVDRRTAAALAAARIPRSAVAAAVARVRRLPADRRRALFGRDLVDVPVTSAVDIERIRDLLGTIGPIELPDPGAPRPFEVTFSHLVCVDQVSLVGSDEPFVVFGIVVPGELGLPPTVRTVATPVYEKVDPGDRRPATGSQNLRLFGETGAALIDPEQPLVVTASLFEHQPGTNVQNALVVVGLAIIGLSGLLVEIPPLAAAVFIAGALTFLIAGLAPFGNVPVATVSISLTAADATDRTADTALVTLPELPLGRVPEAPHYRAVLQLRRG
ncbi:MAG: hypothetical protein ACT4RN_16215 [Pseudonocardia sp.]